MFSISKLKTALGASTYFRDRDDYYLSDHAPAEWWGAGAREIGLTGPVTQQAFHDVLNGKVGGQQEYPSGTRDVRLKNGKTKRVPAHMPGWDATFSAPKSLSIAALVRGDERLIAAHDDAVREALRCLESRIAITRQRTGRGEYAYRYGTGITAALFRHASSRSLDPQLHTHCVIANVLRDPETGKWASIDSREGLYQSIHEAESLYKNGLAARVRELGYGIEWTIGKGGFPDFELTLIGAAERDLFSARKAAIDAQLAAGGITREAASRAQRQQATLETRSPKQPVPAAELHREWATRLATLGDRVPTFARPEPTPRPDPEGAADDAVARAIVSISERQSRFILRDLLTDARVFSEGRAAESELQAAVRGAVDRGALIDTDTLARVPGGDLAMVPGYTTRAGQETERDLLATVDRLHRGGGAIMAYADAKAAADAADTASGGRLTAEHQLAIRGVLADASHIDLIQGLAGSAKTSSVLKYVSAAARERGWTVTAMAPTASAAQTLGDQIGATARTVAAVNLAETRPGERQLWVVDEAGLIGADDMRTLLGKAESAGAKILLVGDVKQIGSVAAGRALDQIQGHDPAHTYHLNRIFRQRNESLLRAVEAAARGDVRATFAGIRVIEHKPAGADEKARGNARNAAVADVAQRYMESTGAGRSTLVVALATADRDAINSAIQQARVAASQVSDVRETEVLRAKSWTKEQQADAARYRPGDVIIARADVKYLEKGHTAEVVAVQGGKVTVRNRDGEHEEWTFDPRQYRSFTVYDAERISVGIGDRVTLRGRIAGRDADGHWRDFANGDRVTVAGRIEDGALTVTDAKGRTYRLNTAGGLQADLGYASTADSAQGTTVDSVIGYVRSNQTNLATQQRLYVLASRPVYDATIVTDDAALLAERIERRSGRKETALPDHEAEHQRQGQAPEHQPESRTPEPGRAAGADRPDAPDRRREPGFLRDAGLALGALARDVTTAQARALRDRIHGSLHRSGTVYVNAAQAAVAARLVLQEREADRNRLIRRRPDWQQWRRMVARHGVAVAPDGTRYTMDDKRRVYSDRLLRAGRREAARSEWLDPRQRVQYRIVGEPGRTTVIVSHDHGRSWKRADLFDSLATRYRTWRRARLQARLELDRIRWQAAGGRETRDSEWLAREAIKSFRQREGRVFKGRLDWDELASRNGVMYDKDGHRYTTDTRGRVWSEALAKRSWAAERTRAGREAMDDLYRHAHHAIRYRLARRRLEKVIGDGQQRELDRLTAIVLDADTQRWREAGTHESRSSRSLAAEALDHAGEPGFDWHEAALTGGVEYDRMGRRYARDQHGHARAEALESVAYHYRYNADARAARAAQARGRGYGPLAWWAGQRTRAAVWRGVEAERGRLMELAGRQRQPEQAPERGMERSR